MKFPFVKMHGTGNDYVYVNGAEVAFDDPAAVARIVSDRRKGIGSDGLILVQPSESADCRMEMYNADGSRGKMCGNGIRCVARFAHDAGIARKRRLEVETDSGTKGVVLEGDGPGVDLVTVDMGPPILAPADIPVDLDGDRVVDRPIEVGGETWNVTCSSMGNPHCVVFVGDVAGFDVPGVGRRFERLGIFPEGVNTEFVEIVDREEIRMRVWERGSGETWACGTGACAAVVASALTDRTGRRVRVHLRGGDLDIDWRESDDHVLMTGDAIEVFRGEMEV